MYILTFDTTAAKCSILLQEDDKTIDKFEKRMDFGQAEALIPQIKIMLEKANLVFSNLGYIIVCVGPGSFTGVRASISAARVFSLACPELVVAGVSAFDSYANSLEQDELAEINAVIIETKRQDFYYQLFDNKLKKITDGKAGDYDEIISLLRNKKVALIGDGVERFLSKPSGLSLHVVKMSDSLPIDSVAYCGYKQYKNKVVDFPKPLYLRLPDACLPKKS